MAKRPFSNADPFLQIIVLFLLSFSGIVIFMFLANGLVNTLWGVNFFNDPSAILDYSNPQIVQVNRVLLLFQHIGMFVVPAIVFAMLVSNHWKNFLGFRKLSPPFIFGAVLVMIAALPAIDALSWLNQLVKFPDALSGLQDALGGMEDSAAQLTNAITETSSPWIFIINLIVVALLPAIGEEMIFRGALIPIFMRWTEKKHTSVWLSAILFSAMHMQFYGFLPRMLLGALLGYLFLWSRSLWGSIIAHFTNNALAVFVLFLVSRGTMSEDVDSFTPDLSSALWLLASFIGVGAICYYLHKLSLKDDRPFLLVEELAEEEGEPEI